MPKLFKDRRSSDRELVIVEVVPKEVVPGKTYCLRDISKTGFKLETNHLLAPGDWFEFSFRLPDSQTHCRLGAQVVWVQQISASPPNYYVGFAFPTVLDRLPEVFAVPLTDVEKARLA